MGVCIIYLVQPECLEHECMDESINGEQKAARAHAQCVWALCGTVWL